VHDLQIRPISLPCAGLEPLRTEVMAQGLRFLERLLAEWENGSRFDQRGERFAGGFTDDVLAAVGGLSRDPYVDARDVGRLRHLYVLNAYRRRG
jgi:hypothetical protein